MDLCHSFRSVDGYLDIDAAEIFTTATELPNKSTPLTELDGGTRAVSVQTVQNYDMDTVGKEIKHRHSSRA